MAWLSEEGHLLVLWSGVRRAAACRAPEVVTWVASEDWRHGMRAADIRAWLLAGGEHYAEPAGSGFVLDSSCKASRGTTADRPLVVDGDGRLHTTRMGRGPTPPRQGTVVAECLPPAAGASPARWCQVDPESGRMWPLAKPWTWSAAWDDATSVLRRPSTHITGTWSVDGGATWHQTWDPWDATVARWAGETYLFSNDTWTSRGPTSPVYRLPPDTDLRSHPHGVGPPDLIDTGIKLPPSTDGYRYWQLSAEGVLVGTTDKPVLYVSRGTDWSTVIRRETEYRPDEVVGRFLVARSPGRGARSTPGGALHVSEDYGRTWGTVDLADVRPD